MDDAVAMVAAGLIGGVASVAVAMISKPDDTHPDHDLTTIAGLAAALTETRTEVSRLRDRQTAGEEHARLQDRIIAAFRRRSGVLEDAMRAAGVPIPPPDPADAALISGSV